MRGLVFGAALALAGCSDASVIAPADAINVGVSADIRGTDPGVRRDANTDNVMAHVVEGLVAYTERGDVAPLLAQNIAISDDEKTYTFKLRAGIRFHNSAPLTADDVVWSWKRYLDPKTGWVCLPDFDGTNGARILSVKALSTDTVAFTLDRRQPMFLTQMASLLCGGSPVLHHSSVNRDGSWRAPVSTGPYFISTWRRGEFIEMRAFKGYKPLPGPRDGFVGAKIAYAPRIRWVVIRDGASRLAALAKGQIDVVPEITVAEFRQIKRIRNVRIISAPSALVNCILLQTKDPLLSDVRIRRALALAIDLPTVSALVTGGRGAANASMLPTTSPYHNGIHSKLPQADIAEAKRLLREAGYNGEPIIMTTNRGFVDMFDQALLVQAMARKVGINIQLRVTEWATQLDMFQNGNFQLMSFSYSVRSDPYLRYEAILGDRDKSSRKIWGNLEARALLAMVGQEQDPAKRQSMLNQMHKLMRADIPLIVLFNPADNNVVRSNIVGFRSWPIGRTRLWGVRKVQLYRAQK